jgi:hypothetical protein
MKCNTRAEIERLRVNGRIYNIWGYLLWSDVKLERPGGRRTEISRRNVVTRYMFWVRKSLRGNIYGSFAPNKTLFARFCTTLAMSKRPRRISFEGGVLIKPSTSGATMAGQKNRRKINAPTAVNFASGNLFMTAADI